MWMAATEGTVPGGHRVQMTKTAESLRRAGTTVETVIANHLPRAVPDVVHGFGLTFAQVAEAKQRGLRVVLSPIYWKRSYYRKAMRAYSRTRYVQSLARQAPNALATSLGLRSPWYEDLTRAYAAADLLLPNSPGEGVAIARELRVTTAQRVVPNGVDPELFHLSKVVADRDCIVYVGRIEPRKNQLRLIEALRGTGLPLVLVGPTHPHHESYAGRCRAAARNQRVEFLSTVSVRRLPSVYQAARVHAMPSFFETTGLASLEAALCGCAIVATREGWAEEYFGGSAVYCRPTSKRSIRSAVERAWELGAESGLRGRILDNYTWAHTARATTRAYEWLLAQN